MRECSRKRPTIERTRMLSLMPGTARTQAADAAHHQVHRHARLRRAIEQPDHLIVGDRVDLDDQSRRTARLGVLGLAFDQLLEPLPELHRRDDHRPELLLIRVAGQVVEDVRDVVDDVRIGGEETEVGVDLRRVGVVVAGARVHVALNRRRLPAGRPDRAWRASSDWRSRRRRGCRATPAAWPTGCCCARRIAPSAPRARRPACRLRLRR